MRYLAGFAAALTLISECAFAQNRIELEPASDWVLNYDDDSCALMRQFGKEGQQAYLEVRQFGPGESGAQFIIASPDFDRRTGPFELLVEPLHAEPLTVTGFDMVLGSGYEGKLFNYELGTDNFAQLRPHFELARNFAQETTVLTDDQRELMTRYFTLVGKEEEDRDGLMRLLKEPNFFIVSQRFNNAFRKTETYARFVQGMESAVVGILISKAFEEALFLKTGELHAPMKAVRTCLDELMTHWGVDVEAHRTLTLAVEPVDQDRWVRKLQEDYPSRMLRQGMQGALRVRLDVSVEGEPTGCHMQSPINDEDFEREACENLIRHAKFNPALDAQGQPIASYWQTAIVYQLER